MKLSRFLVGIFLGIVLFVTVVAIDRNYSWSVILHEIQHWARDSLNWIVAHPKQAMLMTIYVVAAGLLGRVASRSGRSLSMGILVAVTLTFWALPPVRRVYNLPNNTLWRMAITAAIVALLFFLQRETKEHH